jgi:hypothetical protein
MILRRSISAHLNIAATVADPVQTFRAGATLKKRSLRQCRRLHNKREETLLKAKRWADLMGITLEAA